MAIGWAALVAASLVSAPALGDVGMLSLTASAEASARPKECTPPGWSRGGASKSNIWQAARDPQLGRYCDLLARAIGQIKIAPQEARATAEFADAVSPGHAGPLMIKGRALAAEGAFAEAVRDFERARAIDGRILEEPETMRDFGRSLARIGRAAEALGVYRALASRVVLLPGAEAQVRALLEAAELAFSIGPDAADDAIAFLREARRVSAAGSAGRVLAELALALDRRQMTEASASVAAEARRRLGPDAVADADAGAELVAAAALICEATDRARAARGWELYLQGEGGRGPWADHARRHLVLAKSPIRRGAGR